MPDRSATAALAVTDFVVAALEAAPQVDVPVFWGPMVSDDNPPSFVVVGHGPEGESWTTEREWVGLGTTRLDEAFTLHVASEVWAEVGVEMRPVFAASVALAETVEEVLRADPHLSGAETDAQIRNVKLSALQGAYLAAENARGHRMFQTITGTARI